MNKETLLILDFGGKFSHLIARRVRELNVYCEIWSYEKAKEAAIKLNPKGIILTGGEPNSVFGEISPRIECELLEQGFPVLGIDYGAHAMIECLGGKMIKDGATKGNACLTLGDSILFDGLNGGNAYVDSADAIGQAPADFSVAATLNGVPYAIENAQKKLFALNFHPETDLENGKKILHNFLYKVCGFSGDWNMKSYIESSIAEIREQVGDRTILLALSGGVDSSVLAALLSKAVGKRLTCIFVDTGLMRKHEGDEVEKAFKDWDINFVRVDASERFLAKLKGVTSPERKRKIIGKEFINVFVDEAKKLDKADLFAQGTIYPDIIESGIGTNKGVKSHHNVGGLPKKLNFKHLVEPLRYLFKDEVRLMGKELGLSPTLVNRQPFPGPGLAVRCLGEVTREKLDILRDADYIFRSELSAANLSEKISQYFAIITNIRSVGVRDEQRSYDRTIALRAIETTDFMQAKVVHIPFNVLERVVQRIVSEVEGVNRVVYDITQKPPATIEWE